MDATTFALVKRVLLRNGWYYYPIYDNWSTGNTFDDMIISNSYLLLFLNNVNSICHFLTFYLKKPELCKPILSVLPDRYFTEVEFETCA